MNLGLFLISTVLGYPKSMSNISLILPGLGDITITLLERNTASSILCVTNNIVFLVCYQIFNNSIFNESLVKASKAPKGSSINKSFGS